MSDLVIRVRFPAGAYNAGGQRGTARGDQAPRAEWPPAPERVLAAGLAGQADTGLHVVEALYDLDPPIVIAPPVDVRRRGVPRDGSYVRWVPRQRETLDAKHGSNIDKQGDNTGVLVDPDQPVFLVWPGAGDRVEAATLDRVYRRVPYLGRPTSPAVINVSVAEPGFEAPDDYGQIYVPDPAGRIRLSVGSPQTLQARDAAHAIQSSVGRVNVPNVPIPRTWVRYRVHELVPVPAAGGRRAAYDLARTATWFPAAATWPLSAVAPMVAAARRSGASWVVPVIDDERVLGLLADVDPASDEATTGLLGVIAGRVVRARPSAQISPAAIDVLRDYVGSSTTWTTDLPVAAAPGLSDAIHGLRDAARAVHAVSHDEPLGRYTVMPGPGTHYVTVVFDEPVTGPLVLAGSPMIPTRSPELATEQSA